MLGACYAAHRGARRHRRPPHGRARRHRRDDRLVLLPALRLPERVRRDPRRPTRRALPHRGRTSDGATAKQLYLPGHERPDHALPRRRAASASSIDFMPVGTIAAERHWLVRRVQLRARRACALRARPRAALRLRPRAAHELTLDEHGAVFDSADLTARARLAPCRSTAPAATSWAEFTLDGRRAADVRARAHPDDGQHSRPDAAPELAEQLFEETVDYWRRWIARCTYRGRWREMVRRSALALKLLTYRPPAPSSRRRPRACPRPSAACATGTTATPGSATRRSRCTRCCASASPRRPRRFMRFLHDRALRGATSTSARADPDHVRHRRPQRPARRSCSTTARATAARGRCASATARPSSSSSTSTAS